MRETFESDEHINQLRLKFKDADITLSREQVEFLFDYIEALELALSYAHLNDMSEDEEEDFLLKQYILRETMKLPEIG